MPESFDVAVVSTVQLPADLHARPAGDVTRAVARFDAEVTLECAGRTAEASGVLAVMGLGAAKGQVVTVLGRGPEASEAVGAVVAVLSASTPIEALEQH